MTFLCNACKVNKNTKMWLEIRYRKILLVRVQGDAQIDETFTRTRRKHNVGRLRRARNHKLVHGYQFISKGPRYVSVWWGIWHLRQFQPECHRFPDWGSTRHHAPSHNSAFYTCRLKKYLGCVESIRAASIFGISPSSCSTQKVPTLRFRWQTNCNQRGICWGILSTQSV